MPSVREPVRLCRTARGPVWMKTWRAVAAAAAEGAPASASAEVSAGGAVLEVEPPVAAEVCDVVVPAAASPAGEVGSASEVVV